MESMKQYVIRRAAEVKRYREVARATGVNYHWLTKLAQGRIPKPNFDDIQTLHDHYRALEPTAEAPAAEPKEAVNA
jgi:hypothetical protein